MRETIYAYTKQYANYKNLFAGNYAQIHIFSQFDDAHETIHTNKYDEAEKLQIQLQIYN